MRVALSASQGISAVNSQERDNGGTNGNRMDGRHLESRYWLRQNQSGMRDHCYAKRFAERFKGVEGHPYSNGFKLQLHHARLRQPERWRKPRRIFVNSMSDLFHKKVEGTFVDRIFEVMERCPQHTFQVLTKRSSAMRRYLNKRYAEGAAPAHIWFGVSVEDRKRLCRVEHLRASRARMRFLSLEPLLEGLGQFDLTGIDWVIV